MHSLLQTELPTATLLWLVIPPILMFLAALLHSLKHWNKDIHP
jgi:hypothetical protein